MDVQGPASGDGLLIGRAPTWHRESHLKRQGARVCICMSSGLSLRIKPPGFKHADSTLMTVSNNLPTKNPISKHHSWIKFSSSIYLTVKVKSQHTDPWGTHPKHRTHPIQTVVEDTDFLLYERVCFCLLSVYVAEKEV